MSKVLESNKFHVEFNVGDTIELSLKIFEDSIEDFRLQKFTGVCIAKKMWNSDNASITVIKLAKQGVLVEKIVPMRAPTLHRIEVIKKGKVRRSKLYYLKSLKGNKSMKVKS